MTCLVCGGDVHADPEQECRKKFAVGHKRPFGTINGHVVDDDTFWNHVRTHTKLDERGDPILRVERVDEKVH